MALAIIFQMCLCIIEYLNDGLLSVLFMDLQQNVQDQQIELFAVASRLKCIEIIGRCEGKPFLLGILRLYHVLVVGILVISSRV